MIMSDAQFAALVDAINVARNQTITALPALKDILVERGHTEGDVEAAIKQWADYEAEKYRRSGQARPDPSD